MKKREFDLFNILLGLIIGVILGYFAFSKIQITQTGQTNPVGGNEVYGTVYTIQLGCNDNMESLNIIKERLNVSRSSSSSEFKVFVIWKMAPSIKLNISSTKSMHGHLLGAAGAIESLACIHAICDSIVPPTINFSEEDPDIDYSLNLTLNEPQKRTVNVAVNNTFGFGGHNSCLIFKKF